MCCTSFGTRRYTYIHTINVGCCQFYHQQKHSRRVLGKKLKKSACVFVNFNVRCTSGNILFPTGKITHTTLLHNHSSLQTPVKEIDTPPPSKKRKTHLGLCQGEDFAASIFHPLPLTHRCRRNRRHVLTGFLLASRPSSHALK